jgi:hypothetical protein
METVAAEPQLAGGMAGCVLTRGTSQTFGPEERALVRLGRSLKERGYRFTTATPATHTRVALRKGVLHSGIFSDGAARSLWETCQTT